MITKRMRTGAMKPRYSKKPLTIPPDRAVEAVGVGTGLLIGRHYHSTGNLDGSHALLKRKSYLHQS